MSLRLFDNDPGSAPKKRFTDDITGRFRSGYQVNSRPASLEAWRVTTGDPEVANTIHTLLGGREPQNWPAQGEDNIEVFTDAKSVDIIIDQGGIRAQMALYSRSGQAIRSCDGVQQRDGSPCACPSQFNDRKDAAKSGTGCEPSISIVFRLADNPDLGKFRFTSGSWTLAKDIAMAEDALTAIDGPARATLALEVVEFTTREGAKRKFTKPVINIKGAAK